MTKLPFPASPEFLALNADQLGAPETQTVTPSKYKNVKTEAKGMTFQSGHEAAGVAGLILMEEQKQIFGLRLQVRFPLPGGVTYVADATYLDTELKAHVVDFKGHRTREFINKAKQFKAAYGQSVEEL